VQDIEDLEKEQHHSLLAVLERYAGGRPRPTPTSIQGRDVSGAAVAVGPDTTATGAVTLPHGFLVCGCLVQSVTTTPSRFSEKGEDSGPLGM